MVFSEAGATTGAPYRVIDANHWIFRDTGLNERRYVRRGQSARALSRRGERARDGQAHAVISGELPTSRAGLNPNDGGAEIVFFETESGGAVFSVGSINWPSSIVVDPAVSQITRNVLTRFLKG